MNYAELHHAVKFIFEGAQTKRFHTADTLTSQTVGAHSFGVAWLVHLLAPDARKELILAALAHDLAEHLVGDVSSPAKRAFPDLKKAVDKVEDFELTKAGFNYTAGLTEDETAILKCADLMDGMMWCVRERMMGSKVAVGIYKNFSNYYIGKGKYTGDLGLELFKIIDNMWRNANGS